MQKCVYRVTAYETVMEAMQNFTRLPLWFKITYNSKMCEPPVETRTVKTVISSTVYYYSTVVGRDGKKRSWRIQMFRFRCVGQRHG